MVSQKELEALQETNPDARFYKGVLYGEFGMRKTTTALRCAVNSALLIHADRGWNVVGNHPDEFEVGRNVTPLEYQGISQLKAVIEAIKQDIQPWAKNDLIILDTFSQMQEEYIDFLLDRAEYKGNFRDKATPKAGVKDFVAAETPGMPDYHLARNKLRPIVRELVKLDRNVLFLCHVREPGPIERADGKIQTRPNITEALYKVMARDATFIGFMGVDRKEQYTVQFKPKATLSAKSQIAALRDREIPSDELPNLLKEWSSVR